LSTTCIIKNKDAILFRDNNRKQRIVRKKNTHTQEKRYIKYINNTISLTQTMEEDHAQHFHFSIYENFREIIIYKTSVFITSR
jgi:hypothetical protein